jgi:hypothetical protein
MDGNRIAKVHNANTMQIRAMASACSGVMLFMGFVIFWFLMMAHCTRANQGF